jgi:hypothetical protein
VVPVQKAQCLQKLLWLFGYHLSSQFDRRLEHHHSFPGLQFFINPIEASYRYPLEIPLHIFSNEYLQKERPNYLRFILRQLGHLFKRPAAFCPPITRSLAFSGLRFLGLYLLGRPLNPFGSGRDLESILGANSGGRI